MNFPVEVLPARNRRLELIRDTIRTTRTMLLDVKKSHPGDWELQNAVDFVIEEGLRPCAKKAAEMHGPIANLDAQKEAARFLESLRPK